MSALDSLRIGAAGSLMVASLLMVVAPMTVVAQEPAEPEEAAEAPAPSSEESDTRLAERLDDIYSQIDALEPVDVSVEAGVVTLTGQVENPTAQQTAEQIALKFDETIYVRNDVEVSTEVAERVSPALRRAWQKVEEFVAALPLFGVALVILLFFRLVARLVGRIRWPGRNSRTGRSFGASSGR